jgi:hypothetical protein
MTRTSADEAVELVWNKGIAGLCDHRIPNEFPEGLSYAPVPTLAGALASSKLPGDLIADPAIFEGINDGELVWVRVPWLRSFVRQVLPRVKNRFILVTGDSDSCVPSELAPEAKAIVNSPKVMHWFAQNYDGTSAADRISPLPIGIDFHTLYDRAIWGETPSSPHQQEQVLKAIRQTLPALENRIPKVYVDFAWRRGRGLLSYRRFHPFKGTDFKETRHTIAKKLRKNQQVFCQNGPLSRSQMWQARGEYAFVLSPHGVGLDCHRTWEALALGHIVLVPSSALDPLYEGLPVVPLKAWSAITSENLKKWLCLRPLHTQIDERLYSGYWIDRMRAVSRVKARA